MYILEDLLSSKSFIFEKKSKILNKINELLRSQQGKLTFITGKHQIKQTQFFQRKIIKKCLSKCFSLGIILVKFSFRNIYKLIDRKSARLILFGITAKYLPPQ